MKPTDPEMYIGADLFYNLSSYNLDCEQTDVARGSTARNPFYGLTSKLGFVASNQLEANIKDALEDYAPYADWLSSQISGTSSEREDKDAVSSSQLTDGSRIEAYSVMQSFFLGYYYSLFLRFVDTTSRKCKLLKATGASDQEKSSGG